MCEAHLGPRLDNKQYYDSYDHEEWPHLLVALDESNHTKRRDIG